MEELVFDKLRAHDSGVTCESHSQVSKERMEPVQQWSDARIDGGAIESYDLDTELTTTDTTPMPKPLLKSGKTGKTGKTVYGLDASAAAKDSQIGKWRQKRSDRNHMVKQLHGADSVVSTHEDGGMPLLEAKSIHAKQSNFDSNLSQLRGFRDSKHSLTSKTSKSSKSSKNDDFDPSDLDAYIGVLDPDYMTEEELTNWIKCLTTANKRLDTEVWMLEKFWQRSWYLQSTSDREGDSVEKNLKEYEELKTGRHKGVEAVFKVFNEKLHVAMKKTNKKSTSRMSRFSSFATSRSLGTGISSGLSAVSSASSNHIPKDLTTNQKLEVVTMQIAKLKDEMAKQRLKEDAQCQVIRNYIEQHRIHLQTVKHYRKLAKQRVSRGSSKAAGDAIIKFYDDLIREKDHKMTLAKLNLANLRRKERDVKQDILQQEEMGFHLTLVDYQSLEIERDEKEQAHVDIIKEIGRIKRLQGEANYHFNIWRRRMEAAEGDRVELNKELIKRRDMLKDVEAEIKHVRGIQISWTEKKINQKFTKHV